MKTLISRLKYNPLGRRQKPNRKGVAMILAVSALMFMVYIASELTRDSAVEYIVNSQELNRIKAYYAARNSMQLALLRIKLFQQAGKLPLPPEYMSQLDQIWQFPFAWPLPIPADLNLVDKDTMQSTLKESLFDATYTHSISDEGSKIDINDLASPSKTLQDVTKKQLINIFAQKVESDDDFRKKYQNTNFEDLVNKIVDWMSDSETGAGGGDKESEFSSLGEGYPPNRGFRTLEELRLVPGMTDELFDILSPNITIYGMKAINPNTASEQTLLSLDPNMTKEAVQLAIQRRNDPEKGGLFKGKDSAECRNDFKGTVSAEAKNLTENFDTIPMVCDKVINFKIIATGIYGTGSAAVARTITAVVVDLNKSAQQVKTFIDKEKKDSGEETETPPPDATLASGDTGQKSSGQNQEPLPKGPPRVVYWTEN